MNFLSTRGGNPVTLDEAIVGGIAGDGGLFLPEALPMLSTESLGQCKTQQDSALKILTPFFVDSDLAGELPAIIAETFHFDIPVTWHQHEGQKLGLLELFHGPTAAFKDVGAAFLAACITRLEGDEDAPLTVLVATSGDTGGAVAAAFNDRPGIRVVVLYPDGKVSERQAHQLTCWGDNVLSLAVAGTFDDCQALAKRAFADKALSSRFRFSSANSINIGRLLPQTIYYAHASLLRYAETGDRVSFIVPTGNLGNGLACVFAREMGLPIQDIVLATNANRTIPDFLSGNHWEPRASIATLATAMDVGNPSNMERMQRLFGDGGEIAAKVSATSVTDHEIKAQIKLNKEEFGIATCPHTATATSAWRNLAKDRVENSTWIAVATAHPAKFEKTVESVIGEAINLPAELERLLSRPRRYVQIGASFDEFAATISEHFSP